MLLKQISHRPNKDIEEGRDKPISMQSFGRLHGLLWWRIRFVFWRYSRKMIDAKVSRKVTEQVSI